MSTLRTTTLKHGGSVALDNLVLSNAGETRFCPNSSFGRAALYVDGQTNRVGVNTETPGVALDVDGAISATGNATLGGTLTVTGNVIFNGASLDLNSNLDLTGTLDVTGNSTFTGDVGITGDLTVDTDTLFVDASTNCVGIGTSTPSSFNANANHLVIEDSNEVGLTIATTSTGANAKSVIHFANGPIGVASYAGYLAYLHDDDALQFGTNTAEKMRLDSGGRLLVGTSTSPSGGDEHSEKARLVVQGRVGLDGDSGRINLQRGSAAIDDSSIGSISFTDISNNIYARIESFGDAATGTDDYPGRITFSTTADGANSVTERMRIDSSGNVGIGDIVPDTTLHIDSQGATTTLKITSDTESSIDFEDHGGSPKRYKIGTNIDSNDSQFSIKDVTANSERMRIDSAGRLLVGTSSTSTATTAIFQGSSQSANTNADLILACDSTAPGDGGNLALIKFTDGTHVDGARIFAQRDGGTWSSSSKPTRLAFATAANGSTSPTERMRIGSTGRVNIFANDGNVAFVRSSTAAGNTDYAFGVAYSATNVTNGTISFAVYTNGMLLIPTTPTQAFPISN